MTKIERHMELCKKLNDIYAKKNHDYGDSFHDTFVEEGMAMARIRLSDKLNRFKKLSREDSEQKVNDESIRDTLLDLANYAIMTVMEMDILAEENESKSIPELTNKTFFHIAERLSNRLNEAAIITDEELKERERQLKLAEGLQDTDTDPCEKCTYTKNMACCGWCLDRIEWENRRRG